MSIWCSLPHIGFELDWETDEPQPKGGQVRSYATGWSNHYPTTDGEAELEASIDTASIPDYCVRGHGDDDGYAVGPWLRLSVDTWEHDYPLGADRLQTGAELHASVVMDEDAVRALVASLTEWLDRPKVRPT